MIKRNSGFIVASVLAAGVSFFAADNVLTALRPGSIQMNGEDDIVIVETETDKIQETDTYETNPFTITASGAIMDQVESEEETDAQEQESNAPEEEQNETEPQPDSEIGLDETSPDVGLDESNSTSKAAGTNSDAESWEISNWADNTAENGSGTSAGQNGEGSVGSGNVVDILDPGGGTYTDSSAGGNSSGGNVIEIVDPGNGSGNNPVSGSYENGIFSPDDLILWHINSRYISEEELWNYDAATIRYIRNEIFALHGRIFESEDLRAYFSRKAWYVPMYSGDTFDPDMEYYLNDYEWANLQLILAYEELLYD